MNQKSLKNLCRVKLLSVEIFIDLSAVFDVKVFKISWVKVKIYTFQFKTKVLIKYKIVRKTEFISNTRLKLFSCKACKVNKMTILIIY